MAAPLNFRMKRLRDWDKAREGTYVKKIPADPQDYPEEFEEAYHIQFIPDKDMFVSWIGYLKLLIGISSITETTDDIYSEKAIIEDKLPWHENTPGTPEEVVVLLENVEEEAKLMEKVDNRTEAKIAMMERKLTGEQRKHAVEKAKNLAQGGDTRAASDKDEPQRRRDRRRSRKRKKGKKKKGRGRSDEE